MDTKYIIIIGVVAIIVIALVIVLIINKKNKEKKSSEPIHKEYDSSIANLVNDNVQSNTENSNLISDSSDNNQVVTAPLTPMVASNPQDINNVNQVSQTTNTVVEPVRMPETSQVAQSVEQVPTQVTPIMPSVEQTSVINTPQQFANVGTIAEPLVETPVIAPTPQVEEPKPMFVTELASPVVEPVIEEPKPQVATISEAQTLNNYEITLPEEIVEINDNVTSTPEVEKKAPVFVIDVPHEEKKVEVTQQTTDVKLDIPDMEEFN